MPAPIPADLPSGFSIPGPPADGRPRRRPLAGSPMEARGLAPAAVSSALGWGQREGCRGDEKSGREEPGEQARSQQVLPLLPSPRLLLAVRPSCPLQGLIPAPAWNCSRAACTCRTTLVDMALRARECPHPSTVRLTGAC